MQHLLIMLEDGATREVAERYKDQLEERLGIPVTVLVGVKQALVVTTEGEKWPKVQ